MKGMFVLKAASISTKPDFNFMKQTDILLFHHIQIPRWMFFDSRYKDISAEAKMVYGFLLNRFQLSKMNGWVNEDGEVFLIYTRESLSEEIGVSYRKVISCMKELKSVALIWERRCGRGDANQIYMAKVDQNEEEALRHRSAPFVTPDDEAAGARLANMTIHELPADAQTAGEGVPDLPRPAETACLDEENDNAAHVSIPMHAQDLSETHILTCNNGTSRTAEIAGQDMQNPQSSYIDKNNTYLSNTDKSLSVSKGRAGGNARTMYEHTPVNGLTDDDTQELDSILDSCDLWVLAPETAKVFENAIERLWFSRSLKIGKAVLPQRKVRSHLHELDCIKLQEAERKICANTKPVRDSTAYVMAVIFNTIWESESDILVDPYLNSIRRVSSSGGGT
jgi:hypothetical protein